MGPSASAYTHFLRYLSTRAPFTAIAQKFDLNALPNRTLPYYISDQGPNQLASNDSFTAVISQIRLAARVWNDVESSDLRLAFGGMTSPGAPSNGPGVDVLFTDDIPPGLIAQTGFSQIGDPASVSGFVPIQRATIMLNRNMTDRPSFSEGFFLTAVHEFGHAIGLQHSLSSGVMSTEPTRGVSKAKPLSSDDIAGVSLLYPARAFAGSTGTISGRITAGSDGVSMASVVAVPTSGYAVSALSNPDGTYRIEGVPPGVYYVYVHPLPPAQRGEARPANIEPPVGGDGRLVSAGPTFETVFFPGVREPSVPIGVGAGGVVENVNINVQRRAAVGIHSVQTYNFVNQITIKPPTLNRNQGRGLLVAAGSGLTNNAGAPVAGLGAAVLGNPGMTSALRPYLTAPYLQMDLNLNPALPEGPAAMLFSTASDLYVLPGALQIVSKAPPSITALANATDAAGARVLQVTGSNLDRDTRILFDGQPGAVRSFEEAAGRVTVAPPPAPSGHRAAVVVLNNDGQSSLYSQGTNVPSYTYDAIEPTSLVVSPSTIPAGSETVVEVAGSGISLIDGLARLGFGSADVTVRRVWVTAPNRLVASVGVSPNANGVLNATLSNGLQWLTQPAALTIQPLAARLATPSLTVGPTVLNAFTGQTSLNAGSPAVAFVSGLPNGVTPGQLSATINDQPVAITNVNNGQVSFVLPLTIQPGPAILRLRFGNDAALPVVFGIDPPPPVILSAASGGATVDTTRPVRAGDAITVTVFGLSADAFTGQVVLKSLMVNVAGVDHAVQWVSAVQPGRFDVGFTLGQVPPGVLPMIVSQDGRVSNPAALPVR